jgi:hypothetical protein
MASDQANKMDGLVSRSSFGEFPGMFPRVMHSAILNVNFHRLCDPVFCAVITLLVYTFQYLINEILLIIFLSLRSMDKLHQPVGGEKYSDHHFFRPYRR